MSLNETTLADLMKRALNYADFPKDSLDSDQEDQLINDINDGLIELWDMMIDTHEDMVFKIADAITLASGTEAYALPTDFYKAIKLWYVVSGRRYKLTRFNLEEIDGYPKPLASGSVELWYAPQIKRLKNKKALVPSVIPSGWENYAALFAAVRLLAAEGTDLSLVDQQRSALGNRITQMAGERDETPESIGDHYNRFDNYLDLHDSGYIRLIRYRIMGTNIYFSETELGGV